MQAVLGGWVQMPLEPSDYQVHKALQGVNLEDPPHLKRCVNVLLGHSCIHGLSPVFCCGYDCMRPR